jgi:phosphoglycolate phosphatase-like HAD superfamily hydrolase
MHLVVFDIDGTLVDSGSGANHEYGKFSHTTRARIFFWR